MRRVKTELSSPLGLEERTSGAKALMGFPRTARLKSGPDTEHQSSGYRKMRTFPQSWFYRQGVLSKLANRKIQIWTRLPELGQDAVLGRDSRAEVPERRLEIGRDAILAVFSRPLRQAPTASRGRQGRLCGTGFGIAAPRSPSQNLPIVSFYESWLLHLPSAT